MYLAAMSNPTRFMYAEQVLIKHANQNGALRALTIYYRELDGLGGLLAYHFAPQQA